MVLARISKLPVQSSNSNISAHPDTMTNLLQILIPAIVSNRAIYTSAMSYIRWFLWKLFFSKLKILYINFCLFKKEVFMPVPKTDRIGPGKIPAERVVLVLLSGKNAHRAFW